MIGEGDAMTIFYHDGGPGPAMHMLRVDAESESEGWWGAPTDMWTVRGGWEPAWQGAQADIRFTGEFFPVAASEVPKIQEGMRDWLAQFE
jgi:hypothetical protein